MPVKTAVPETAGVYFITFTCCKWLPLFDLVQGYDLVYKWFDYLQSKGHHLLGYVIMPNHLHVIIAFSENEYGVNKIVSNGKRFIAYDIVKRLLLNGEDLIIAELSAAVTASDIKRGKKHQVFEPSFDCKDCRTLEFIWQKLNYIHKNPVKGKWKLSASPIEYKHSSAKYYYTQEQGYYPVLNFLALSDREWAKKKE